MCQWRHLRGRHGQLHLPVPPAVCGYVGVACLWEVRSSTRALNPIPETAGALPQRGQEVSAGPVPGRARRGRGGFSLPLLVLPPGRACEQLVDFCSPDLNPCQHEAQCVGTPDGPR